MWVPAASTAAKSGELLGVLTQSIGTWPYQAPPTFTPPYPRESLSDLEEVRPKGSARICIDASAIVSHSGSTSCVCCVCSEQQGVNVVESVQFSDSVIKVNKREKHQKRDLVITTSHIYNFKELHYKACRRCIPIASLRGIVLCRSSEEVLLQVRGEYDYRLLIVRQADAIRILVELFESLSGGAKLPIDIVDNLASVQVLKVDVQHQKGSSQKSSREGSANDLAALASVSADDSPRHGTHLAPPSPHSAMARHKEGGTRSNSMEQLRDAASSSHSIAAASSSSATATAVAANAASSSSAAGSSPSQALIVTDVKPAMEGWLTKKGAANLAWRRRYFRLADSNLLYYEARPKGSVDLAEAGGEVRAWVNKRLLHMQTRNQEHAIAGAAADQHAASTDANAAPTASSSSGRATLAPLLYEFKLSSSYNITPERHMKDILGDPDRLAAFTSFCEATPLLPPKVILNHSITEEERERESKRDEGANAKFYARVEKFKAAWTSHSDATTNSGIIAPSSSSGSSYSHHLAEAHAIYSEFLACDAANLVVAPSAVREALGDLLARHRHLCSHPHYTAPHFSATLPLPGCNTTAPPPSSLALATSLGNTLETTPAQAVVTIAPPIASSSSPSPPSAASLNRVANTANAGSMSKMQTIRSLRKQASVK